MRIPVALMVRHLVSRHLSVRWIWVHTMLVLVLQACQFGIAMIFHVISARRKPLFGCLKVEIVLSVLMSTSGIVRLPDADIRTVKVDKFMTHRQVSVDLKGQRMQRRKMKLRQFARSKHRSGILSRKHVHFALFVLRISIKIAISVSNVQMIVFGIRIVIFVNV